MNVVFISPRGDGGALRLEGGALFFYQAIFFLAYGCGFLGPEGHGSRRLASRCAPVAWALL